MHELSLAQSIVDLVEEQRVSAGFARVRTIRVSVGVLSSVDPRALEFGFDVVARGTVAEGAALAIERPPGRAFCTDCEQTVAIATQADACPICAGHRWKVVGGQELRVVDLEVE
jgi:hydrogenase nickel incorporation protein HypA/HybF